MIFSRYWPDITHVLFLRLTDELIKHGLALAVGGGRIGHHVLHADAAMHGWSCAPKSWISSLRGIVSPAIFASQLRNAKLSIGVHDGVHFAMDYRGNGVPMSTYLGDKVAKLVLGRPEGGSVFAGLELKGRPYYNGTPWFLAPAMMYYKFKDRFLS